MKGSVVFRAGEMDLRQVREVGTNSAGEGQRTEDRARRVRVTALATRICSESAHLVPSKASDHSPPRTRAAFNVLAVAFWLHGRRIFRTVVTRRSAPVLISARLSARAVLPSYRLAVLPDVSPVDGPPSDATVHGPVEGRERTDVSIPETVLGQRGVCTDSSAKGPLHRNEVERGPSGAGEGRACRPRMPTIR